MTNHCTERLSEYLDDELTPTERTAVDAHLASCAECAGALDALRRVVQAAHALPAERTTGTDHWPAIEARIGKTSRGGGRLLPWRLSISMPQLAAAATLLVAVGMGLMWLLSARQVPAPQQASTPPAADVIPVALAEASYDAAIADLEAVLDNGRGRLDPDTVRVLEENLATIDRAIAQAREALEADPANVGLNQHLLRTRAMRLALLRRAVTALPAPSS